MAFNAKTNWQTNDTVMPEDMNRIEKGIFDAQYVYSEDGSTKYKWGVTANGIAYLEEV